MPPKRDPVRPGVGMAEPTGKDRKPARLLEWIKPLAKNLPEVEMPYNKLHFNDRVLWTLAIVAGFLICSRIPLLGISTAAANHSDPFGWARVLMASRRGALLELGMLPVLTATTMMQLLAGLKFIDVDVSNKEDRILFHAAQKMVALTLSFVQALCYVASGAYGHLGLLKAFLGVLQLTIGGVIVLLLDELLNRGYGIGNGFPLFMATSICEHIAWQAISPVPLAIESPRGTELQGAVTGSVYMIVLRYNKFAALWDSLFRSTGPNLVNVAATAAVFVGAVYMQGWRVDLPVTFTKARGVGNHYPVRLFYTSSMPAVLLTAVVTNVYFFSQMASRIAPLSILGRWKMVGGQSVPVGGLAYHMWPPQSFREFLLDPVHSCTYAVFVIATCAAFNKVWVESSGAGPKAISKWLRDQNVVIKGYREGTMVQVLQKHIPIAAALGGICVGALTFAGDIFGAVGSGTGILLAVTVIFQYYEALAKEKGLGSASAM